MTTTEPNITTIKEAIITILKASTALWDNDNHEVGFQDIRLGVPDNAEYGGLQYPICYVTNDINLETDQPFGPVTANEVEASLHTINLRIIFFDQKEDAEEVEKSLDSLYKTIKEVLKANNSLNSNVTDSFPIRGHSFNLEASGKPLDGRVIVLRCSVGST